MRTLLTGSLRSRDPGAYAAADAITDVLTVPDAIDYDRRAALYAAAAETGADEIARLFFSASPKPIGVDEDEVFEPERQVHPRGKVITLGERKSLARSHRRDVLGHLLRDPHPDVVAVLLDNPHMTERDVVVVASRRPAAPALLERVATHGRWRVRYRVKRALVLNPFTPLHVALRLVATLRIADLRSVSSDVNLDEVLRTQASDLLGRASG